MPAEPGRHRPEAKAGARVAVRSGWGTSTTRNPPPGGTLWPILRAIGEHFMVAGPIFGLLSALYVFHLSTTAPHTADPATHAVIREIAWGHRHFDHAYFITPAQNALEWTLAVPAVLWLILLVLVVVGLGVRSHYQRQR